MGRPGKKSPGGKKPGTKKYIGMRYATEEGEMYAVVSRIFGGAQCEIKCIDGALRRCIIRAKFRGRRKRNNHLDVGTWVLAGLRDFGNSCNSKQICDLLTVYTDQEKDTLLRSGTADFSALGAGYVVGNTLENVNPDANEVIFDEHAAVAENSSTTKLNKDIPACSSIDISLSVSNADEISIDEI